MSLDGVRVRVDENRCASTGTCAAICPDAFEMLDDGTLRVTSPAPRTLLEDIQEAAEMCPTGAIEYDAS